MCCILFEPEITGQQTAIFKSIPSLELHALALATETIEDWKKELSGPTYIDPIVTDECEIYSDSLVVLLGFSPELSTAKVAEKTASYS